MFGVSFPELLVLGTVALLVLGPDKLPGMLRTIGQWLAKLRRLTTEVRHQSGIDDVLRAEGFDGGLNELRSVMRGGGASPRQAAVYKPPPVEQFVADKSREYPVEGPDAYGALPEDLLPGAQLGKPLELTAGPDQLSTTASQPPALHEVAPLPSIASVPTAPDGLSKPLGEVEG